MAYPPLKPAPPDFEAHPYLKPAFEHILRDEIDAGQQALVQQFAESPGNATVTYYLGLLAYQKKDGATAEALFGQLVELDADNSEHRYLLACARFGQGNFAGAFDACRITLRMNPAHIAAHHLCWLVIEQVGLLPQAAAALKQALSHSTKTPQAQGAATSRINIADTTLCAIDCATPALAARAMAMSMQHCNFEQVKLLTSNAVNFPGIKTVGIDPIRSSEAYSAFVMKELLQHIDTKYVLIVQWDGYVINPAAWDDAFFEYDYIGALWQPEMNAHLKSDAAHNVGNGGFSLRSTYLLECLQDTEITQLHPEDGRIGMTYRHYLEQKYGIVFAPDDVASRFSHEHVISPQTPFGFHGLVNLAIYSGDAACARFEFFDLPN